MSFLVIDGGTTNTRITLARGGDVIKRVKLGIGAGSTAKNGSNEELKQAVFSSVRELSQNEEIAYVAASGMIGSELGLANVMHITTPVDIKKLAENITKVYFDEFPSLPFYFIPGIKCMGDSFETTDIMRGEETELFGIDTETLSGESLVILPGTHAKFIKVENGVIKSFSTSMCGEITAAISRNTILSKALPEKLSSNPDGEYLAKGYEYAKSNGIAAAMFKVRILSSLFSVTAEQLCGFFTGAILSDDIDRIAGCGCHVIIGGTAPLNKIFYDLSVMAGKTDISMLSDEQSELLSFNGAVNLLNLTDC